MAKSLALTRQLPHYFKAFAPPLVWAIVIYSLSAQEVLPSLETSLLDFIFKKTAHMFVYAVLYWLLYRAFYLTAKPNKAKHYWWVALLVCLAYAATDEIHQSLVPGRHPTVRDIGYDLFGASTMMLRKLKYI